MDELIKFLTTKIGYTLTIILGFIVPGNMFVFVWNRNLYMEMNIIKLLLLSFGIPFLIFIPCGVFSLLLVYIMEKILKKESSFSMYIWVTVGLEIFSLSLGMIKKVFNNSYTITDFLKEFVFPLSVDTCVLAIIAVISLIVCKIKKKIKKELTIK